MIIGIYSRKSKITEKGDSIENQVKLCESYIRQHYSPVDEIIVYEDEGFSGGNTERPMFKRLLRDINSRSIDVLVCYRLDRISRNVVDFSTTLELLQEKGVGFASIKENFDTTSPMGRAMVYISSVFAQLERETIAERIRDNLLELAKSGRYLHSIAPVGYVKDKIEYVDKNGHAKYYNLLKVHEEESRFIQQLFNDYMNLQSIKRLETALLQSGHKTRNGKTYKCISIRRLLTHPIYCAADETAFRYFENLGCQMIDSIEKFTGDTGVYVFKRSDGKGSGSGINSPEEWHIGAGSHEPLVSSAQWIKTQEIIESRRSLSIRRPIGKHGLLSGILKCENCGDYMRPFSISGDRFYYICATKEASKKQLCTTKNLRGDKLDSEIIAKLTAMDYNRTEFKGAAQDITSLESRKTDTQAKINELNKQLTENKAAIANLINKLAFSSDPVMEQYITEHVNKLDNEKKEINKTIHLLKDEKEQIIEEAINSQLLIDSFNRLKQGESNFQIRRNLLKNIIKDITYNGEKLTINFNK